jgi:hypothetical protein
MKKKKKSRQNAVSSQLTRALEEELLKAERSFAAGLRASLHVSCKSNCKSVKTG